MYLQRLLQINMATLAGLATLLLSMGQDSPAQPLLVWLAAGASIWLTDVKGWVRLNRTVAGVCALAIGVYFIAHVFRVEREAWLLDLADLVVCLQVVLFFQKKDPLIYWLLAIISLSQVIVAAFFSHGGMFGLVLVLYMMTGVSALALLFLYSQGIRYGRERELPRPLRAGGSRGPHSAAEAAFTGSSVGGGRAGIVAELFQRLAMLGLGTLVLATVIFFTVPRRGYPAWRGAMFAPQPIVGFTDTVALGQLGEVLESREEVMRVELTEVPSGRMYPIQHQLYLRGAVLTNYNHGQWSNRVARRPPSEFSPPGLEDLDDPPDDEEQDGLAAAPAAARAPLRWVRQRITVEPLDRDELFCIWPSINLSPADGRHSPPVFYDPAQGRWLRAGSKRGQRFTYQLGTTALADGQLKSPLPCNDPGVGSPDNDRPAALRPLLQVPPLPHLAALARQWVGASGLGAGDRIGLAHLLEEHLGRPGQFQYSLEEQHRDPALDPIEDFVSKNPRGHCEYFATALALMLRSQGIPARVVLGYRCEEWNNLGKFYQVRQSDAHAWVEAYLAPRYIPQALRWGNDDHRRWAGGAWLRLDPTPTASEPAGHSAVSKVRQGLSWIDSLWADYVVDMDSQRQREAVFQPLVAATRETTRNLCSAEWWRAKFHAVGNLLNLSRWNGIGGWLLHVGLPLLLAAALAGWLGRGLGRRARGLWRRLAGGSGGPARRARPRIEFYRRFELLLARKGLVRAAGQTPREFALLAADHIAGQGGREQLAAAADLIVDAFYRVRFGGLPLDNPQREAVEHGLAEWEHVAFPRREPRH